MDQMAGEADRPGKNQTCSELGTSGGCPCPQGLQLPPLVYVLPGIVGWWKEHFEELLTNTSSVEEAESEDSGEASSMHLAEVSQAVKKLLSGKVPGVDEIHPEMLKALDIVGLSGLTCLFSVAWMSVPGEWQTGVVVSIFKKGDRRVVLQLRYCTAIPFHKQPVDSIVV